MNVKRNGLGINLGVTLVLKVTCVKLCTWDQYSNYSIGGGFTLSISAICGAFVHVCVCGLAWLREFQNCHV